MPAPSCWPRCRRRWGREPAPPRPRQQHPRRSKRRIRIPKSTTVHPFDNAIVIAGPTASGKTRLALELARALEGEIIGADSLQVYRDVPVTSCQPTAAERAQVPHHLVGFLGSEERMTAARFGELARAVAADIVARGRRVFLVGGTGLYLRAALEGLVAVPPADPALRARLLEEGERRGRPALHDRLREIDPASAARLNPNDLVRVVRSLEVHALTGKTQTALHAEHQKERPQARWFAVDLPRERLYDRIAQRTQEIFSGVVAEAEALAEQGFEQGPAGRALGIAEALRHLGGELSRAAALEAMVQATRRYAKRQLTWFRAVEGLRWLSLAEVDGGVTSLADALRRAG